MPENDVTPESGLSENPEAEISQPDLPREVSPEELADLERKLAEFKDGKSRTVSGSEAPSPDLSDFELPPGLEHLYKRGKVEDTAEGAKWVTAEHQVMIATGNYSGTPGSKNKKGEPMRLDEIINLVVNGPDGIVSIPQHGWRLSAIIPNNSGMGVAVFERNVKRILPDPTPVVKETPVEPVKDEELKRMNEEAQQWAAEQRGESGEPDVGQN